MTLFHLIRYILPKYEFVLPESVLIKQSVIRNYLSQKSLIMQVSTLKFNVCWTVPFIYFFDSYYVLSFASFYAKNMLITCLVPDWFGCLSRDTCECNAENGSGFCLYSPVRELRIVWAQQLHVQILVIILQWLQSFFPGHEISLFPQ